MEILLLEPTVKSTIWGGRQLIDDYGFKTDGDNAAEAWLLSCHKDGASFVVNGSFAGQSLQQVLASQGKELLGTNAAHLSDFPVLIKLIDAKDRLSVQVHPDDAYAMAHEHENGKTEAWYIINAVPGAQLIYGVNHDMTKAEFAACIENGTLLSNVNTVEVKAGDTVFIPSGTLHAIGAGILLAEVQQSSNTTYRVFDYMRRDKNGRLRELHTQKAVDVVNLSAVKPDFSAAGEKIKCGAAVKQTLCSCGYFTMTAVTLSGEYTDFADKKSFVSLLALSGEGEIKADGVTYKLKKGSSAFIPAGLGEYTLSGEKLSVLETRI